MTPNFLRLERLRARNSNVTHEEVNRSFRRWMLVSVAGVLTGFIGCGTAGGPAGEPDQDGGVQDVRQTDAPSDVELPVDAEPAVSPFPFLRGKTITAEDNPLALLKEVCSGRVLSSEYNEATVEVGFDGKQCACKQIGSDLAPPGYGPFWIDLAYQDTPLCNRRTTTEQIQKTITEVAETGELPPSSKLLSAKSLSVGGKVENRQELYKQIAGGLKASGENAAWVETGDPLLFQHGIRYREIAEGRFDTAFAENGDPTGEGLIVGKPSDEQVRRAAQGLLNGLRRVKYFADRPAQWSVSTTTFELQPQMVPLTLGLYSGGLFRNVLQEGWGAPNTQLSGEDDIQFRDRKALAMAYDKARDPTIQLRDGEYQLLWGKSCKDACRLFLKGPESLNVDGKTYSYVVERIYSAGAIAVEQVWVAEILTTFAPPRARTVGAVQMSAGRWPGMIAQFVPQVTADRADLVVRVFDRTWTLLGEPSFGGAAKRPSDTDVSLYRSTTPKGSLLVQCEAQGFDPPLAPDGSVRPFAKHVLYGPYTPQFESGSGMLRRGSLYGWVENPGGTYHDYVSGVWEGDFGIITNRSTESHGTDVLEVAVREFDTLSLGTNKAIYTLPRDNRSCFQLADWQDARNKQIARVVNGSFALSLQDSVAADGSSACSGDGQEAAMEKTRKDVLWVFAAGNNHSNSFVTAQIEAEYLRPTLCPQMGARARSNALLVAALDGKGGWLDQKRYVGADYADIAANGRDADNTPKNAAFTSFSAPRVSAIAVAIAQMYPSLTSAQIRAAILVSADPRDDLKDKVRAEGELNGERALKVAACLNGRDTSERPWDMGQEGHWTKLKLELQKCATGATGVSRARVDALVGKPGFLGK